MPNAANATVNDAGSWNLSPSTSCADDTRYGVHCSAIIATIVLIVKAATIKVEPTSTTLYRPVTSSRAPDPTMAIRSSSRDTLKFIVSKISTQPPISPAT